MIKYFGLAVLMMLAAPVSAATMKLEIFGKVTSDSITGGVPLEYGGLPGDPGLTPMAAGTSFKISLDYSAFPATDSNAITGPWVAGDGTITRSHIQSHSIRRFVFGDFGPSTSSISDRHYGGMWLTQVTPPGEETGVSFRGTHGFNLPDMLDLPEGYVQTTGSTGPYSDTYYGTFGFEVSFLSPAPFLSLTTPFVQAINPATGENGLGALSFSQGYFNRDEYIKYIEENGYVPYDETGLRIFSYHRQISYKIDRVVVSSTDPVPAPVPLPAAAPLLAAGLGALALLARRRRS